MNRILVVGVGSIGKRHIKNLKGLGIKEILVVEKDKKTKEGLKKEKGLKVYHNLNKAKRERFDGALICTPPSSHIEIAEKLLDCDVPLFIEKPLSHTLKGVDNFIKKAKQKKTKVLVGYNLRFHPGIILVKELIQAKRIGRLLSIRIEAGQYLPDWRPKQDYKKSYTARKDLGGGIILEGSHEIDYLLWFLEKTEPEEILCFADTVSNLRVETEDTAEILIKFNNGSLANIHLDFIQRGYSRSCKLIGEKGTIIWNYPENKVKLLVAPKKQWQVFNVKFKPNDMYVQEMKHFLKVIKRKEEPRVNLEQGREVLRIALLAKEAAKKRGVPCLK